MWIHRAQNTAALWMFRVDWSNQWLQLLPFTKIFIHQTHSASKTKHSKGKINYFPLYFPLPCCQPVQHISWCAVQAFFFPQAVYFYQDNITVIKKKKRKEVTARASGINKNTHWTHANALQKCRMFQILIVLAALAQVRQPGWASQEVCKE